MGNCCCEHCNGKDCGKEKVGFTKDTTVGEVLDAGKKYKTILEGFGLHCFGCPMSQMETLKEASKAHEIDLDFMLETLNKK